MKSNLRHQRIDYRRSPVIYLPAPEPAPLAPAPHPRPHGWSLVGAFGVLLVAALTIGALALIVVHALLIVQAALQMSLGY